jgi:hypothetical protein
MKSKNLISNFFDFMLLGGSSFLILPLMYIVFPPGQEVEKNLFNIILSISLLLDYAVNFPHFSYSYQIFYSNFNQKLFNRFDVGLRRKFIFAGIFVPIILLILIVCATLTAHPALLSAIINIRLLTFGWHYAKQGYGIFTLLCRLQNFTINNIERRIILLNTHIAWICAWVQFNSLDKSGRYFGVHFTSFVMPTWLIQLSLVVLVFSALILVFIFLRKYLLFRSYPPLNGVVAYLAAVYLWIAFRFGLGEGRGLELAYIFAPFFHSLQYFSVVQKLKRTEFQLEKISKKSYLKFMIGGFAIGGFCFIALPHILNKSIPYDKNQFGMYYFTFVFWSFINIHHFFLDNVIWRREGSSIKTLLSQLK